MRFSLIVPAMLVVLTACQEEKVEVPSPVPLTEAALSHFCQMNVLEHGGPKAQIHLEGFPAPIFFAQVRDAVAYLKSEERDARVEAVYTSDMGKAVSWNVPGEQNWTPADSAFFVVDAGVRGGMGAPEIVPFGKRDAAEKFVTRYGGRIVPLSDIPDDAAIGPVDPDVELEDPT